MDRAAGALTRVAGLPDSFVKWVAPDDRGYLWVAMQNALARYCQRRLKMSGFSAEVTSLGLSRSYDIITQGHGGTLTVESVEGQGATFIVTLPTNQTEADY